MRDRRPLSRRWGFRVLRREAGASAVEFALIAPLFFMITFGMITGAIAFNQKNQMTHAAREGARFGATLNPQDFATNQAGWAQEIIDVTIDRSFGDLAPGVAGRGICVALVDNNPATLVGAYRGLDGAGPSTGPCFSENLPAGSDPGERVQVLVQRSGELNAILFQMDLTLASDAVARVENQG